MVPARCRTGTCASADHPREDVRVGQGIGQDSGEAIKWYKLAAQQGDPDAQSSLGDIYFYGRRNVPRDDAEALRWYKLATAGFAKLERQ